MTELRGFDLDGETSRAWRAFASRLADHLSDMEDGDSLEIGLVGLPTEAPSESSAVLFTGAEGPLLQAELRVLTVPLDDGARETSAAELLMLVEELGWEPAGSPVVEHGQAGLARARVRAHQSMPRRESDRFASLTVRLLCEVLGAVHPVFLRVSGDHDLVERSPDGTTIADARDLEPPLVTTPVDSAHLRELVTQTIAADLGGEPAKDADGDIMLDEGTVRVFVRVLDATPLISIFSRLVKDVQLPYEANAVVSRLNAEYSFVKFSYGANSVVASVHLPASPFVPAQLRRMLATFTELADKLDDELVSRLDGRHDRDPQSVTELVEDKDGELPEGISAELATLLEMDPEGNGLNAEVTAEVCHYDMALTRQLMHIATGQEAIWRAAAEECGEDPVQEARCYDEAAGWKATWHSLAGALELISSATG